MDHNPFIVIGAGPAGLMAAQYLAIRGHKVHVYEQNKATARKFLVAGDGGFNLTHSEPIDHFVEKYDAQQIKEIVRSFDNQSTRDWLSTIGIPTYIGSSGKVFPERQVKPIHVLKAWLQYLQKLGVIFFYQYQFVDFDKDYVYLNHKDEQLRRPYQKLVLGLGGGSWAKTGSDASWVGILEDRGVQIRPLQSANSGYNTLDDWSALEGQVLKNIAVRYGEEVRLGEIVFTQYGIEGSPLYYMNRFTRKDVFPIDLYLDLKPNLTENTISGKLRVGGSVTHLLKEKLNLSKTAINLLKSTEKTIFMNPVALARLIKCFPIRVVGLRPIDEVISTAGGVSFDELDENLALHKYPNVHCVGEMLDWEAPTGGYLLQACFSTGAWVGRALS